MDRRHEQTFLQRRQMDRWLRDITHYQGNTNQNHNEIPPQTEWLTLTTQATTDVGEDAEKKDLFCMAGGNASWCSHSGKIGRAHV